MQLIDKNTKSTIRVFILSVIAFLSIAVIIPAILSTTLIPMWLIAIVLAAFLCILVIFFKWQIQKLCTCKIETPNDLNTKPTE